MQRLYKATFRTDVTHRSVGNVMSHERLFLLSFLPVNFSAFYIQVMSLNLTPLFQSLLRCSNILCSRKVDCRKQLCVQDAKVPNNLIYKKKKVTLFY